MRVFSEQLAEQLKAGLRACYLIFGDEPLQKMEALQQIRQLARLLGTTMVVADIRHAVEDLFTIQLQH
jgi:DNA polymerase-3 subunit delta